MMSFKRNSLELRSMAPLNPIKNFEIAIAKALSNSHLIMGQNRTIGIKDVFLQLWKETTEILQT